MERLLIIFLIIFVLNFLFCKVELQGKIVNSFVKRTILLLIFSAIVTIFIGLPILFIVNLFI